ncbi:MAG: hypothetical protein ACLVBU_12890 [Hominisplanchenecus sp.]
MDERSCAPPRYGAEHPVDVRFAPIEADPRKDCGSATHGAIRW